MNLKPNFNLELPNFSQRCGSLSTVGASVPLTLKSPLTTGVHSLRALHSNPRRSERFLYPISARELATARFTDGGRNRRTVSHPPGVGEKIAG